jgi:hypothetical protein
VRVIARFSWRIAAHERRYSRPAGAHRAPVPSAHVCYAEWMPTRPLPAPGAHHRPNSTEALVTAILTHRAPPEQGFPTCLGILRLYRGIEPAPAEAGLAPALKIGAMNYRSVASTFANNPHRAAARQNPNEPTLLGRPNLRGGSLLQLPENNERSPIPLSINNSTRWACTRGQGSSSSMTIPKHAPSNIDWLALLLEHETTLKARGVPKRWPAGGAGRRHRARIAREQLHRGTGCIHQRIENRERLPRR